MATYGVNERLLVDFTSFTCFLPAVNHVQFPRVILCHMSLNSIRAVVSAIIFAATLATYSFAQADPKDLHDDRQEVPSSVAIARDRAVVPMDLVGRKPVIEVKINGKGPYTFFLDTGAGATVINKDLADQLALPKRGQVKIGDPADPQGLTADRDHVDTLEIGGAMIKDFIAVSWDRSILYKPGAPRGVIGMPLFRNLLLTVDYPAKQVIIENGTLKNAPGSFDYQKSDGGLFGIPITVGSTPLVATMDTGSQGGLSFPPSYMETLPLVAKPVEIGRGRTVAGEAIIYGAKLKESLTIGPNTFENADVTFFGRLTNPNMGYGILSNYAITIDQRNQKMRWTAATGGKPQIAAVPHDAARLKEYVGLYGIRRVATTDGELYLQRLSGPQGEGPVIRLFEVDKDTYSIDASKTARIKFVRDKTGKVTELQVLTPDGKWESTPKGSST